jgi:hypothetical protein
LLRLSLQKKRRKKTARSDPLCDLGVCLSETGEVVLLLYTLWPMEQGAIILHSPVPNIHHQHLNARILAQAYILYIHDPKHTVCRDTGRCHKYPELYAISFKLIADFKPPNHPFTLSTLINIIRSPRRYPIQRRLNLSQDRPIPLLLPRPLPLSIPISLPIRSTRNIVVILRSAQYFR